MIYFDNASTTYPKPKIIYDKLGELLQKYGFNPQRGSYKEAKETKELINETISLVAYEAKTSPFNVILTKSATESINIILKSILKKGDVVVVSPFEHNAVLRCLKALEINYIILPTINNYDIDILKLNDLFVINKPKLIILSHISNVCGYIFDYNNIFLAAKNHHVLTLLDAAQSFVELTVNPDNIDFLVFSGHKTPHSLSGVGGIINYHNISLEPLIYGGTGSDSLSLLMPDNNDKFYAGTQDLAAIFSLKLGIEYVKNCDNNKLSLTKYLIDRLNELDDIRLYLPKNYTSYGIVSFNVKGYSANEVAELLEQKAHILVRSGFHCAALLAEHLDYKKYGGTVRVSLGLFNTKEEIDILIDTLEDIIDE